MPTELQAVDGSFVDLGHAEPRPPVVVSSATPQRLLFDAPYLELRYNGCIGELEMRVTIA